MPGFTARFAAALGVAASFAACATTGQPLYAEFALDPSQHPESIDCFYECLRSTRPQTREACLASCDGVVATVTTEAPCGPGAPRLCRAYEIAEEAPDADDGEDDAVAKFVFDLLSLAFDAALDGSDDGDAEAAHSAARSNSKRSSHAATATPWGSKSGVRSGSGRNAITRSNRR